MHQGNVLMGIHSSVGTVSQFINLIVMIPIVPVVETMENVMTANRVMEVACMMTVGCVVQQRV